MSDFDVTTLSLPELKKMQREIAKLIENYEDRRKSTALQVLEDRARELGFNLAELTGLVVKKARTAAVPKFRNPANKEETWSGRGRKPGWYSALLTAGKTPDDLLI